MRIRPSIIWFIVITVALIALVLWHFKKHPTEMQSPVVAETNIAHPVAPTPNMPKHVLAGTNTAATINSATSNMPNLTLGSKVEREIGILSTYNDQPIVFYGRIIDQFSNAVADATVNFGVRIRNGHESTVKYGQILSDANGLFTISGYRGESLGIGVKKAGYVFVSMNGSGIYSKLWPEDQRAHPDPNNPTIIQMWKSQGAQTLIHFSFSTRIPYDGTPVAFDFRTGEIVNSGGNLVIRLDCPLKPNTSEPYEWRAVIQLVDGGIISDNSSMELKFEAPDSGYMPEFDIENGKDVKSWSSAFHGGFYFRSKGGNLYGKFDLGIVIYAIKDGLVPITLDGYINPSGSRNLEIDPKLVTEAHP